MLELLLGAALVGSLTFYLLLGGADFGAGIWSLFAFGHHAKAQRVLIDQAIGPIWEANHVWLIVAVTILFTAFPDAYTAIVVGLHIPLSLMLVGIVLRGTAFALRTHDVAFKQGGAGPSELWWYLFAGSSLLTPMLLGMSLGAIASGRLRGRTGGSFYETFVAPWFAGFPFGVGLLTALLVAYLAATYLMVESRESGLKRLFRRRALAAWALVGVAALGALYLARTGAPEIYRGLTGTAMGLATLALTAAGQAAALFSLLRERDRMARLCAAAVSVLMLWGWALSQFPFLVEPDVTIYHAAEPATLRILFVSLAAGSVLLIPLLRYLYGIFKSRVL